MFDVSFVELLIIGVVALVVLGPEKLPAAARTVGGFVRKARRSWQSVRSEFERELATDELKHSIQATAKELDVGASVREAVEQAKAAVDPMSPLPTAVEAAPGVETFAPPPAGPASRAPHD